MVLCKKKRKKSAAEYHCRTRYTYCHLLAFLASEHEQRFLCLRVAGEMKTLTYSLAHASLLHFCQQKEMEQRKCPSSCLHLREVEVAMALYDIF